MSGRIAERFTQVVTLESGKLGILSRAWDGQVGAPALVLQLSEQALAGDDVLQAVMQDNRRLAGHSRALLSYAWGRSDGQAWIATEATEGALVEEALKRRDKLEMPQLLRLARALAEAAQSAETAGVAHLDIGPHRLWTEGEGFAGAIRVFGFGWWRLLPAVSAQPTELFYGAPEYMAAEICKGHAATPAAEVYSAATTIWTMAATKPPFQSSQALMTLKRQAVEKPLRLDLVKPALKGIKELQGLVAEALDKDPAKRPAASAWLAAIDAVAATWAPEPAECAVPAQRSAVLAGGGRSEGTASAGEAPAAVAAVAAAIAAAPEPSAAPATSEPAATAEAAPAPAPAPAPAAAPAVSEPAVSGPAVSEPAASVPAPAASEPVSAAAASATASTAPATAATAAADSAEDEEGDEEDETEVAPGAAGAAGRRGKKGKKGKRDRQTLQMGTVPAKVESRPAPAVAVKVEPAKVEPAKVEPAKIEPAKPVVVAPVVKTDPAKTEPAKTEPAKTEPAKTEPVKTEPAKVEPAKTEQVKGEASKPVIAGTAAGKDAGKPAGGHRAVKTTDRVRVEQMHETAFFDADHEPPKELAEQGPPVPPPTKVSKPLVAFLVLFALAMIATAAMLMLKDPPEVPATPAEGEAPATVAEPAAPAPAPAPPAAVEPAPAPAPPPVAEVAPAAAEGDAAAAAAPEVAPVVAAAPAEDPAAKAKLLVDEGENLLREKQADAALAKAKQALEINPGFAPAAALQKQAEDAAAEAAKAAAEAAKVAAAQQEAAAAANAKQAAEEEAKRKADEEKAQKAEAARQKQAAAEEAARKKADEAAAKKAAAAQAKEAAAAAKAKPADAAKARPAEEGKKPKEVAKAAPPPVKKDPPPVVSQRPPPAGEPSDAQKEAAKFAALAQKANTAKLKVLYLRKATEKDPGNSQYKNLLKQAEGELANQQPSP